uniref:Extended synaptotagmin-like protein 2a n=1 Tax=Pygocentrus nattereri TaxID=42514 RepID=A0AAR2JQA5_PYGNA
MSATVNEAEPKPGTAPKTNGLDSVPKPATPKSDPLSELEPDGESQSSVEDAKHTGIKFVKTFLLVFPIYVLGYLEFSFSWILIGLAVLFWLKRNQSTRFPRVNRALAFFEHEERFVRQSLPTSELPPWVHFPDVERVEWLNKTVQQMWPYICQFVDKLFRETIEPAVKGANSHLSSFCFSKIDMGDKPLRVNGVKVYTENVDKRQIIMDLQISFIGNTEIDVEIKKYYCKAGIKSIQLHGVLRVIMEPLLGDMPLIGALSVFFLKKPFRINSVSPSLLLSKPLFLLPLSLSGLCDGVIEDIICSYLVLPNKISIPLVEDAQMAKLRFPIPKGVLRVHFMEAQDLLAKDTFLGGLIKGKSDPYGVIKVGNRLFQSKVIKDCLNPKWNEVYEWFVLDDVSSGKLHLKLEWLTPLSTSDKLDQVLSSIRADKGQANDGLASALLVVHLDSARNLPVSTDSAKKVSSDPSPFVQFRVGHKTYESKTRYKTNEPVWEEAFTFLIHNPRSQELEVEVKDERHECTLGTLTLPLTQLLEAGNMTLSHRFPLKSAGPSATLKMKMALRVGSKTSVVTPKPPTQLPSAPEALKPVPENKPLVGPISNSTPSEESPVRLAQTGKSASNLAISGSQLNLNSKEPTPSIASDISNPFATQELQHRIRELQNGSAPNHFPLGQIELTIRHSSHRNKLVVVVHQCRNLIAFTDSGSDPYVRLYLLPDKRRSGRRKTHTVKKKLNPTFDESFEFTVSLVELHRRTLDVAVKNGGGILSKHKGLLAKKMRHEVNVKKTSNFVLQLFF